MPTPCLGDLGDAERNRIRRRMGWWSLVLSHWSLVTIHRSLFTIHHLQFANELIEKVVDSQGCMLTVWESFTAILFEPLH